MKVCYRCGKEKQLTDFFRNRTRPDGYQQECKTCRKEMRPPLSLEQRERAQQRTVAWRQANPERKREQARSHYIQNREDYIYRAKEWRQDNLERARQLSVLKEGRRRARKRNTTLDEKIDFQEIVRRYGRRCNLCYLHVKEGEREIDHIIPLSKKGTHTVRNLALTHRSCNRRKHNDVSIAAGAYFKGWLS